MKRKRKRNKNPEPVHVAYLAHVNAGLSIIRSQTVLVAEWEVVMGDLLGKQHVPGRHGPSVGFVARLQ